MSEAKAPLGVEPSGPVREQREEAEHRQRRGEWAGGGGGVSKSRTCQPLQMSTRGHAGNEQFGHLKWTEAASEDGEVGKVVLESSHPHNSHQ